MSTNTTETKTVLKGGEFLIKESTYADVFTKDELTEEQKMFAQTAQDFISTRVHPNLQKIDKQIKQCHNYKNISINIKL